MANPKHVELLRQGVVTWNHWRREHPDVQVDLIEADLEGADLEGADLKEARLQRANLNKACLDAANLFKADLLYAELRGARLSGAYLKCAGMMGTDLRGAILAGADLRGADLWRADFTDADVTDVIYDNAMVARGVNVRSSIGSPRFVRHILDLDYIEEIQEKCLLKYLFWKCTSNCGRSMLLWALTSLGLALLFGAVLARYPVWGWLPESVQRILVALGPTVHFSDNMAANGFTPYYLSITTFATLGFGQITPTDLAGQIWLTLEVVCGYVMFCGLITLFAARLVRRADSRVAGAQRERPRPRAAGAVSQRVRRPKTLRWLRRLNPCARQAG